MTGRQPVAFVIYDCKPEAERNLRGTAMIGRMTSLLGAATLALGACAEDQPAAPADRFFERVGALCGQAFEGRLVSDDEADADWRGERMVMHVRDCSEDTIRIPLHVGEDRSRTWVLSRTADGLTLKHDHRHEDGSEDDITQYGGDATGGTASQQDFPADAWTRELIPYAANNTWTVVVQPGELFSYRLRRAGTDRRFRVDFDLATAVDLPSPPWGALEQ
jgi:hypothetical protein